MQSYLLSEKQASWSTTEGSNRMADLVQFCAALDYAKCQIATQNQEEKMSLDGDGPSPS